MQSLATSGYTEAQVATALHAGALAWDSRYEVVDLHGTTKGWLTTVYKGGCSVKHDVRQTIRRTLQLRMVEDPDLNPLADRVRPWARLAMPDGGFAEWALGTFLLTTPPRGRNGSVVERQIAGYDLTQVLTDDKVEDRLTVGAGAVVTDAVVAQLSQAGLTAQNVQPSDLTLPVARDWKAGTPRSTIVGDLLAAINYAPLRFDAFGVAQVTAYVALDQRPVSYLYADDATSVMLPTTEQGLDAFGVPNVWVGYTSEADKAPLRSEVVNSNPASSTSTLSRGRRVVSVAGSIDAVDQATLDAAVARLAEQASQVYETVTLNTGLMPVHDDEDMLEVRDSVLGIATVYRELAWSLQLQEGTVMQHTLQKLVTLG